ncbi:MAG: hypothetical protein IPJ69_14590 [Deltaproteobacteria bacterium]|nr:MAG: hypothetical protein IPJ69_14590 [Deltaproteobacteria bacterium]
MIEDAEVLVKVLTPSKKNLILRTISILEKVAQDCRGAQTRLSGLGELADLIDDFREQLTF